MARKKVFIVFAISILLFPRLAAGQPFRIGALGLAGQLLPLWVAQDRGLFAQHGLKSEVITFQAGVPAIQALLSGEIKVAATGGAPGVNAKLGGADIVAIAEWINTIPYVLVVRKEIDQPAKLKGKKIAISRVGSLAHYSVRLALRTMGLDPDRDVQIVQVGSETVRLAALRQGAVDATVLTPPANLTARNLGFRVLTSLQEAGVKYSFDIVFVMRDFAGKNRDTVIRFLKGFLQGIAYTKTRPAESIETLRRWMRMDDQEALGESYKILAEMVPARPYGTEEGWRNLLESMSETNPKGKPLTSKEMFDYSYLQEIEKSGFIDSLYK